MKISVHNPLIKWSFIGIITLFWCFTVLEGYSNGEIHWGKIVDSTGELAWKLLMFTVFISLGSKLFPKMKILKKILPLRKYTGIFAFMIAVFHGLSELLHRGIESNFPAIIDFFSTDISMIFGFLGALFMLLPFLTSTLWAVKVMGPKTWKNIQRLSHGAFIFTILHILLLDYVLYNELDFEILLPFCIYCGGYGYLFWKKSLSQ